MDLDPVDVIRKYYTSSSICKASLHFGGSPLYDICMPRRKMSFVTFGMECDSLTDASFCAGCDDIRFVGPKQSTKANSREHVELRNMKNGSVLLISYILLDCCILLNYGAIVFSEPLMVVYI
jgi:hypothetical protein